jgi:transposase-like protein
MRWRRTAVESVRPSRFRPAFCPWPECDAHLGPGRGFHRHGSFRRKGDPRRVPRFLCLDCRRTCSRQTFSCTYYLKRPELLPEVAAGLVAGSAHRQIARSRGCNKTSVTRLAERLSRHAVLLQARAEASLPVLQEPVVHDHFETFVGRQDRALGIGTAVASRSRFVFGPDPAPHRGAGRRPDRQERVGEAGKGNRAYVRSISRSLDRLARLAPADRRLVLVVDGRKDYTVALREHPRRDRFRLRVHPNPERGSKGAPRSREAIARDRAMAPVDQLHQLIRHTCADHKRETIAFGRRL